MYVTSSCNHIVPSSPGLFSSFLAFNLLIRLPLFLPARLYFRPFSYSLFLIFLTFSLLVPSCPPSMLFVHLSDPSACPFLIFLLHAFLSLHTCFLPVWHEKITVQIFQKGFVSTSVVDPDPTGSASFCRFRSGIRVHCPAQPNVNYVCFFQENFSVVYYI